MSETENSVIEAVVADQPVDVHDEPKKSQQDNFANLRKAKEDLERQLWQAQKEREFFEKQLTQRQMQSQQVPVQAEEDFDYRNLEAEEFPDGKKLVKAFNTVNKRLQDYESKLAAKDQEIQLLNLQTEFPDYRQVVTVDNIEKYIKSDEDNLESVQGAKNPLRKAYNIIKKSAAYQTDLGKTKKSVSQEQQRVDEKETKPKLSGVGVRSEAVTIAAQMSNSQMTREQRNALWKETEALARKS